MLIDRLEWAKDEGMDPPFVIGLFHHIIPWYIDTPIAWRRKTTPDYLLNFPDKPGSSLLLST
ncbi:hypothetical protein [Rouxiella chamberiensis]|uniref:Uncharacterized protein n=1 Tax=Rouxiella chamberiensis TaxID=1513468 RepID=A0ABY7HRS1_9GAMM|nr:hypothetical protein [Rouxiella chamberiensis]WAT02083.1 hypothetical protein O1V66_05230 [Rouxiella chamberiensis]